MGALGWSRLQLGFTITYHHLFPQLTMGLALVIMVFKALALRSRVEQKAPHADVEGNVTARQRTSARGASRSPPSASWRRRRRSPRTSQRSPIARGCGRCPPPRIGSATLCPRAVAAGREGRAFLLSCAFLASLLFATVGTLYPVLLRSTIDAHYTLDAFNASSPRATLVIGLSVWIPAMLLAIGYFTYVYRSFRGKVQIEDTHH